MRLMAIAGLGAAAALLLGGCDKTGDPSATSSSPAVVASSRVPLPPLAKKEACAEFAKVRTNGKPDEPFMKAFTKIVEAGKDKTKVTAAVTEMVVALQDMRAGIESVAASTTDAQLKAGLTDVVTLIKKAETDLPATGGDQAKALGVLNTINLRQIDDLCQP